MEGLPNCREFFQSSKCLDQLGYVNVKRFSIAFKKIFLENNLTNEGKHRLFTS